MLVLEVIIHSVYVCVHVHGCSDFVLCLQQIVSFAAILWPWK